jgi:uncharacterized protein YndB with AHSA1/START domain
MMCAMRFRHELVYDAPPAEVFEMLADPAFREASAAAQDVVTAEVDLERQGNGFRLTIDQEQRTSDLPTFARTFTGDTTRAVQREHWEDSTGGTLHIDAPGKPSDMRGTITLRPEGSRTTEIVELDLCSAGGWRSSWRSGWWPASTPSTASGWRGCGVSADGDPRA